MLQRTYLTRPASLRYREDCRYLLGFIIGKERQISMTDAYAAIIIISSYIGYVDQLELTARLGRLEIRARIVYYLMLRPDDGAEVRQRN